MGLIKDQFHVKPIYRKHTFNNGGWWVKCEVRQGGLPKLHQLYKICAFTNVHLAKEYLEKFVLFALFL